MALSAAIDFGTSNTTAFLAEGREIRPVPLDPRNRDPFLLPTLLYFNEGMPVYGATAIARYLEEELAGRLIQSIKRHLPSRSFEGTSFGQGPASLEVLIGGFLKYVRQRLEETAQAPVRRVLLGRPARFHKDPECDQIAQDRLEAAARFAGFEDIAFQYEPVAAARSFERSLDRDILCLVADLGGGTTDYTLIRLGPQHDAARRHEDILGVTGLSCAGNDFDAQMVWRYATPHFGVQARYQPAGQQIAVPDFLHHALCRWHSLCHANTPRNLEAINRWIRSADDKAGLQRLHDLIAENFGFLLFRSVEQCKIALGTQEQSQLVFSQGDIHFSEHVDRVGYTLALREALQSLEQQMDGLLVQAGVRREDVDVLFLTGGSSRLYEIQSRFRAWFPGKVVEEDSFGSVGKGLGIEAGERF